MARTLLAAAAAAAAVLAACASAQEANYDGGLGLDQDGGPGAGMAGAYGFITLMDDRFSGSSSDPVFVPESPDAVGAALAAVFSSPMVIGAAVGSGIGGVVVGMEFFSIRPMRKKLDDMKSQLKDLTLEMDRAKAEARRATGVAASVFPAAMAWKSLSKRATAKAMRLGGGGGSASASGAGRGRGNTRNVVVPQLADADIIPFGAAVG
mmetsp:Transcript_3567/g.12311  ORF Transcript_3567/g.12311 Transcript_3567/m.12311 type:complete len:208 (+) Transcript_3567:183-806(+)